MQQHSFNRFTRPGDTTPRSGVFPARFQRVADPGEEPVTLAEAKVHLRVDFSDDDAYITALISAAREYAEDFTHRAFIEQTWVAKYEYWPLNRLLRIPRSNLMAVESVTYYDSTGTLQTIDPSNYVVNAGFDGSVAFRNTYTMPTFDEDRVHPLEVTFTAGFGEDATSVPQSLKHAIYLLVSHFFEMRTPVITGLNANKVPDSYRALLEKHKVVLT